MMKCFPAVAATLLWASFAHADLKLCARYDWTDGAKDVSGSPIRHDGVLDSEASVADGKLLINGWDGVWIGNVPELDEATQVLFRFEDVTFTQFGTPGSGFVSGYPVLAGDGMAWWVAVHFTFYPQESPATHLVFDLGGYGYGSWLEVKVADAIVDHFDSIDYRLDATAPVGERFAIRWNDGPWMIGGLGDPVPDCIPTTTHFRLNNGGPADWDPMWGSLGPVSIYSNIAIPEPASCLLPAACLTLLARKRRS